MAAAYCMNLSYKVAELYNIDAYVLDDALSTTFTEYKIFLYQDSARCFDLMCQYQIDIRHNWETVYAISTTSNHEGRCKFDDDDREKATRIAILECLIKMRKS